MSRWTSLGRPAPEHIFNSGFLLIDAPCTGERVYADQMARMDAPEVWRGMRAIARGHGDRSMTSYPK